MEVRRIDAVGNVEIMTAKEYARGREGVYHVDKELATLEGDVKITQGENQLNGDYAEVNMATGLSRLLGAKPGTTAPAKPVTAIVLPRAAKEDKEAAEETSVTPEKPAGETSGGNSQ